MLHEDASSASRQPNSKKQMTSTTAPPQAHTSTSDVGEAPTPLPNAGFSSTAPQRRAIPSTASRFASRRSRASTPDSHSTPPSNEACDTPSSAYQKQPQSKKIKETPEVSSAECSSVSRSRKRKRIQKKKKKKADSPPVPPICVLKTVGSNGSSTVMDIQAEMLQFLNNFKSLNENSDFYMLQIERRVLVIDFNHIVSANKKLAFTLCNTDDDQRINSLITQAANEFFTINGLPVEKVKVHVMNMPDSIADAEDVLNSNTLVKQKKLFCGKEEAYLPTAHGSVLYDLILCGLLEQLVKGETWRGGLSLKDLLIACYPGGKLRLFVTKKPFMKSNASNEDKALDVASVWPLLERFYISDGGILPLYFDELKEDLLTVTAEQIGEEWFIEYLRFHVALASSMARQLLVTETFHNVRKFRINQWPDFYVFFNEEPMARDWREIAQAHEILQIIYDFKENQGKRRSGKEQSEKGGKCGTSKETSYQGKTGTEGEQAEGKSESGKEQSQRGKKKGKDQRNEEPQEAREKCVQAEKEGPVIAELEEKETAIKEKSESGKVQSERKWKGKQQEAGGTCGILKDTSKEGKTAECKQAERMAAAADSQEVEGKDIVAEPKGEAIECEETDYFTAEEEFARVDPYRNTRHSLLFYKRHSLQHIDDYIKVDDLDEVEYFAAKSLHEFLPKFIKGILKINNMGGKLKRVWSLYKAGK